MKNKENFYIGWQDEMPDSNRSFLKRRLWILFLAIPLLVFLFVFFQKPFNDHQFKFGNITNITGTYYHTPFPILIADNEFLPPNLSNEILLVGYGKFGAEGTMDIIQNEQGSLHGKRVTLGGTLIYGDGKTILELTKGKNSLVSLVSEVVVKAPDLGSISTISVQGEIVDPKCYFGVMKPGEGKIHKSCAIRCISGGIPPVFRNETGNTDNPYEYFLILGQNGDKINSEVLSFVGEPVSVEGQMNRFMNWNILYINSKDLKLKN